MRKNTVYFGVFTALALLFSYVESLIPFHIGIPGVKLGLANLIIVIALYKMNDKQTFLLMITRIILAGFLFGNMFSIFYSLAGGFFSLCMMKLLKQKNGYSVVGVSVIGGVFHNVGQLVVAMLVTESLNLSYYFPILLVSGVLTGVVIGIVANEMLKRLTKIQF